MSAVRSIRFDYHFHDDIEFNADRDYTGECVDGCSGMCRCRVITDLSAYSASGVSHRCVTPYRYVRTGDSEGRVERIDIPLSAIDRYCIDRLLTICDFHNVDHYEASVTEGFYGEYINGAYCSNDTEEFERQVSHLLGLENDISKVLFVLESDYGYLAPSIENCTQVEMVDVLLSDIVPAISYAGYTPDNRYHADIHDDDCQGVLLRGHLVDGHHRFHELNLLESENPERVGNRYRYLSLT